MKADCFAYKMKTCTVLKIMVCKDGSECPFYKTRKQFKDDAEKARKKYEMRGNENAEQSNNHGKNDI